MRALQESHYSRCGRVRAKKARALSLQKQKVGRSGSQRGVERWVENIGCGHLAQEAQERQGEGLGVLSCTGFL